MAEPWAEGCVPCFNGDCPGMAEPEFDDGVRYFACPVCLMEFGHVREPEAADPECQLGVPEDIRRAAAVRPPAATAVMVPLEVVKITCPRCGMTSYNPTDVREGYCGNCHDWTGRVPA